MNMKICNDCEIIYEMDRFRVTPCPLCVAKEKIEELERSIKDHDCEG